MKLSIIIPVYNTSNNLDFLFENLLQQGLKTSESEVLFVNDGSTDDSLSKLKSFEDSHKEWVRVFTQDNRGVAIARNEGMKRAKGDFIYFMDSDDYLVRGVLGYLCDNYLSGVYDVIIFGFSMVDCYQQETIDISNMHLKAKGYSYDNLDYPIGNIWSKIYKRNVIRHTFQNFTIAEDFAFDSDVYLSNPRYIQIEEALYCYYQNPHSLMHNVNYKNVIQNLQALHYVLSRGKEEGFGIDKVYNVHIQRYYIFNFLLKERRRASQLHDFMHQIDNLQLRPLIPESAWKNFVLDNYFLLRIANLVMAFFVSHQENAAFRKPVKWVKRMMSRR